MLHRHQILNNRPLIGAKTRISFLFGEYESRYYYWEVVETLKKLFLTGLIVQISMFSNLEWLFMAIILSFVVLMMQMLVQPYKTRLDNVMGTISAMMLVLVFTCVFALQTEANPPLIFIVFTGVAFFLILVFTIFFFIQSVRNAMSREARLRQLPRCSWLMDDGQRYACFLSHYKEEAGAEARYLKDSLDQMLGCPVYLDASNLADLRELFASGVHVSEVFVLLLTENVLTRPWCLLELHEAARRHKPIVMLSLKGKRFDFDDAFELLSDLEGNLPSLNPHALDELRSHLEGATLSELAQSVKQALEADVFGRARAGSVPTLNLSSTSNQLEAQLVDLVGEMTTAAGRPQLEWSHKGSSSPRGSFRKRGGGPLSSFTSPPQRRMRSGYRRGCRRRSGRRAAWRRRLEERPSPSCRPSRRSRARTV